MMASSMVSALDGGSVSTEECLWLPSLAPAASLALEKAEEVLENSLWMRDWWWTWCACGENFQCVELTLARVWNVLLNWFNFPS